MGKIERVALWTVAVGSLVMAYLSYPVSYDMDVFVHVGGLEKGEKASIALSVPSNYLGNARYMGSPPHGILESYAEKNGTYLIGTVPQGRYLVSLGTDRCPAKNPLAFDAPYNGTTPYVDFQSESRSRFSRPKPIKVDFDLKACTATVELGLDDYFYPGL